MLFGPGRHEMGPWAHAWAEDVARRAARPVSLFVSGLARSVRARANPGSGGPNGHLYLRPCDEIRVAPVRTGKEEESGKRTTGNGGEDADEVESERGAASVRPSWTRASSASLGSCVFSLAGPRCSREILPGARAWVLGFCVIA